MACCVSRTESLISLVVLGGMLRERTGTQTYFVGSNGFFPRKVVLETAFEPLKLAEDLDLSIRLSAAGQHIYFNPKAISYESPPASLRSFAHQHLKWVGGWIATLSLYSHRISTHPEKRTWFTLLLWPIGIYFVTGALFVVLSRIAGLFLAGVAVYCLMVCAVFLINQRASSRLSRDSSLRERHRMALNITGSLLYPINFVFLLVALCVAVVLGGRVAGRDTRKADPGLKGYEQYI